MKAIKVRLNLLAIMTSLWQSTVYNETITNIECNCVTLIFWNSIIINICSVVQLSVLDPWFKVQIV